MASTDQVLISIVNYTIYTMCASQGEFNFKATFIVFVFPFFTG